ncbi:hypothetical protein D3C75_896660 [compost metagenome]
MATEGGLQLGGTRPHHQGLGHTAIQGKVAAHAMAGRGQQQALAAPYPPAPAVPDGLSVQHGAAVGPGQRQPAVTQEAKLGRPQHQLDGRSTGRIAYQPVCQDQRLPVQGAPQSNAEMAKTGATEILDCTLQSGANHL